MEASSGAGMLPAKDGISVTDSSPDDLARDTHATSVADASDVVAAKKTPPTVAAKPKQPTPIVNTGACLLDDSLSPQCGAIKVICLFLSIYLLVVQCIQTLGLMLVMV